MLWLNLQFHTETQPVHPAWKELLIEKNSFLCSCWAPLGRKTSSRQRYEICEVAFFEQFSTPELQAFHWQTPSHTRKKEKKKRPEYTPQMRSSSIFIAFKGNTLAFSTGLETPALCYFVTWTGVKPKPPIPRENNNFSWEEYHNYYIQMQRFKLFQRQSTGTSWQWSVPVSVNNIDSLDQTQISLSNLMSSEGRWCLFLSDFFFFLRRCFAFSYLTLNSVEDDTVCFPCWNLFL